MKIRRVAISSSKPTTAQVTLIVSGATPISGGAGGGTKPWTFIGTWFPGFEDTLDPGSVSIGDGTLYPVTWLRSDGDTTDDQICQFEWTTKTVRRKIAGTVDVTICDPGNVFNTATFTVPFSFNQTLTPLAGTTWKVREPSDIILGAFGVNFTPDSTTVGVTAPWGSDSITVSIVDTSGGQGGDLQQLFGIVGSDTGTTGDFTQYVKGINNQLNATGALGGGFAGTNPSQFGGSPTTTGFTATLYHGSGTVYQANAAFGGTVWHFTDFSYVVTDNFTQPPNI